MRETRISIPELVLVGATRGMLGMGIGLLIAELLGRQQRRAVGATLLAVGALSTIPLAFEVLGKGRIQEANGERRKPVKPQPIQPIAD